VNDAEQPQLHPHPHAAQSEEGGRAEVLLDSNNGMQPEASAEVVPIVWEKRFAPDTLARFDMVCLQRLVMSFGGGPTDEHGVLHDHAALVQVLVDLARNCFTADLAAFQPTPAQLYQSLLLVLPAATVDNNWDRVQCVVVPAQHDEWQHASHNAIRD